MVQICEHIKYTDTRRTDLYWKRSENPYNKNGRPKIFKLLQMITYNNVKQFIFYGLNCKFATYITNLQDLKNEHFMA